MARADRLSAIPDPGPHRLLSHKDHRDRLPYIVAAVTGWLRRLGRDAPERVEVRHNALTRCDRAFFAVGEPRCDVWVMRDRKLAKNVWCAHDTEGE